MGAWQRVATADVPGGGALALLSRGNEFVIQVDGRPLMASRDHRSEDALGALAVADLPAGGRLLIGGLGMGFTLAAALRNVDASAQVEVAELVPEVVDWNHGILGACAGHPLDDPRVCVAVTDVASRYGRSAWDAIALDVDNGPDAICRPANARLYADDGVRAAWDALRPNGVLCAWGAARDDRFEARLQGCGFDVRRVRGPRGSAAWAWVARRRSSSAPRHRGCMQVSIQDPRPASADLLFRLSASLSQSALQKPLPALTPPVGS